MCAVGNKTRTVYDMAAHDAPRALPIRRMLEKLVAFHNQTDRKGGDQRLLIRGYIVLETTDGVEEYVEVHPTEDLRGWEFAGLHTWASFQWKEVEEMRKRYP